jgi:hypothetical protein
MRKTVVVVAIHAILVGVGTLLVPAAASASPPVHSVKGGGVFFLDAGRPAGGNLILEYSINTWVDRDGVAHGFISSTIMADSAPPSGGHPDPFGTGDPVRYAVTDMLVDGNTAFIAAVVVFAPDFPDAIGTIHLFMVADNGGPDGPGDEVSIDGDELPPIAAGGYTVR